MSDPFFAEAARTYAAANVETVRWMLARPVLHGAFVNTKMNSITLKDYGAADGWRGPDFTYGWIQGRALEALCLHGADNAVVNRLYHALDALVARTGHAYFCYDADLRPVIPGPDGAPWAQTTPDDIYTFADAFAAKGLMLAAARNGFDLAKQRAYLDRVIASIPAGRFQMDEKLPLGAEALARQPDDFGPRMILLGAAWMVAALDETDRVDYADDFIAHVLAFHFDPVSGLLRTVPGGDSCNVGHALEFVGFVMEYLHEGAPPDLVVELERILVASFNAGFTGPGIRLAVSAVSLEPTSPYCPWWSLPETIRAAALIHERTRSAASLDVWKRAHAAFFTHYWRAGTGIAFQTMTADGPVDFVPATPDLDPGYHTGLSLLAAQRVADRLS